MKDLLEYFEAYGDKVQEMYDVCFTDISSTEGFVSAKVRVAGIPLNIYGRQTESGPEWIARFHIFEYAPSAGDPATAIEERLSRFKLYRESTEDVPTLNGLGGELPTELWDVCIESWAMIQQQGDESHVLSAAFLSYREAHCRRWESDISVSQQMMESLGYTVHFAGNTYNEENDLSQDTVYHHYVYQGQDPSIWNKTWHDLPVPSSCTDWFPTEDLEGEEIGDSPLPTKATSYFVSRGGDPQSARYEGPTYIDPEPPNYLPFHLRVQFSSKEGDNFSEPETYSYWEDIGWEVDDDFPFCPFECAMRGHIDGKLTLLYPDEPHWD